jgi:ATP-binding cassette, subfamily B, bacterial
MEILPQFPWRVYAEYFRPHLRKMTFLIAAGCVQSVLYVPFAALLRRICDVILPSGTTTGLWTAAAGILALQLGGLLLSYWMNLTALGVNENVTAKVRNESLAQLYQLPRTFHTTADLDKLHVTLVFDTERLGAMNQALTLRFFPSGLSAIALFGVMLWIDARLALVIGVAAPVLLIFNRLLTREAWFRRAAVRLAFTNFSRSARFVITAMDLTRNTAAEEWELQRQHEKVDALHRAELAQSRFDNLQDMAQGGVLALGTLAVLVAGGFAVAHGSVSRGAMMAFYVSAALFASHARAMVGSLPAVRMGMRAFQEISDILLLPDREPYRGSRALDSLEEIRISGVSFAYPGREDILEDLSLVIPRGSFVALVGANGSGKSSIVHLIGGYYRPQSGGVFANGLPYDELSMRALRSRIAIVPQDPFLFAGTVRDNILYGRASNAAHRELDDILEWSGAAQFVRELPAGLDTDIGDHGVRLSGGQRQSLVIARALLRRPDLLILDEPTNHLDAAAIQRLANRLGDLPFRPAVLVISHETHVLQHADQAYRLENRRLRAVAIEAPSGTPQ